MKIIGYNASPHKNGNTAWTVTQILDSAKENGADTEIWHAGELDINPCNGCLGCVKSGKCSLADDMQKIYASLKDADGLVLGAPIYMGQMSAQAKIFTDRLFSQITPRFSPHFKEENAGKKLVLIFTQGNPDTDKFKIYCNYTKQMFQLLEFDVKDMIIITGTRTETASEKKNLFPALKEAGAKLVI